MTEFVLSDEEIKALYHYLLTQYIDPKSHPSVTNLVSRLRAYHQKDDEDKKID